MSDPYAQLLELAEREHALATAGRHAELAELAARRDALVAALPPVPPASARPALEAAAALQARTTATLAGDVRVAAGELARLSRGRTAVRGYTSSSPAVHGR